MPDIMFETKATAEARPPVPALPKQSADYWRKLFAPLKAVKQLADAVQPYREAVTRLSKLREWFRVSSRDEISRLEAAAVESLDAQAVRTYLEAHLLFRNDAAALELQNLLRRAELKLTAKLLDQPNVKACAVAALEAGAAVVADKLADARKAEVTRLREHGIEGDGSQSAVAQALDSKLKCLGRLKSELENGTVSRAFGNLFQELAIS